VFSASNRSKNAIVSPPPSRTHNPTTIRHYRALRVFVKFRTTRRLRVVPKSLGKRSLINGASKQCVPVRGFLEFHRDKGKSGPLPPTSSKAIPSNYTKIAGQPLRDGTMATDCPDCLFSTFTPNRVASHGVSPGRRLALIALQPPPF